MASIGIGRRGGRCGCRGPCPAPRVGTRENGWAVGRACDSGTVRGVCLCAEESGWRLVAVQWRVQWCCGGGARACRQVGVRRVHVHERGGGADVRCLRVGARGCVIAGGGEGGGCAAKGKSVAPAPPLTRRQSLYACVALPRVRVCVRVCVLARAVLNYKLVARALLATQGLDPTAFWTANACWRT